VRNILSKIIVEVWKETEEPYKSHIVGIGVGAYGWGGKENLGKGP